MTHPGKLIAVEGIDGAGTTTQAGLLVEELRRCLLYTSDAADE